MLSLFINWDISPEIFNLGGISIRYYGLLFAVAFILGYKVEEKMFKSEGLPMAWLDKLWLYVAIATIVVWDIVFFTTGLIIASIRWR